MSGDGVHGAAQELRADLSSHRIEGIAVHGDTPFDVSLISHIEGNLYMGGCPAPLPVAELARFRYIANLYPWEPYAIPVTTTALVSALRDEQGLPDPDQLALIVGYVLDALPQGPTLVHCQAGLNRSGLVCAIVLIVQGAEPADAIALLRDRRCDAVLCNTTFETHIRSLAAKPVRDAFA